MKGYFLEEIMNGKYQSEQEIMSKAFFIDLDFTGGYHAIHLKYRMSTKQNTMNPGFHNEIFEYVTKYMSDKGIHVLIGQKTNSLLLLLPQKQLGEKKVEHVIYPFMSFLRKKLKGTDWYAGISSMHSNVFEEVKEAFKEAQTAVKLSTKDTPITFFHELGILGVLVSEDNTIAIRKIAQRTLGDLYKNLDQSKVELMETLYTFLSNGGNFEQTAEQLAISISGLRYRLNKITNLIGSEFRDPESRFQLLLSLKALIILEDEMLGNTKMMKNFSFKRRKESVNIQQAASQLLEAEETKKVIKPLTDLYPDITVDEAYYVQLEQIRRKVENGAVIVGKKIGATSKAIQQLFQVNQPDYGHLLDDMMFVDGETISLDHYIQPKAEFEIAFVLKKDLKGPNVTVLDVVEATDYIVPAIEIIDSQNRRLED